jgi:dUTP pyrophosphatase
LATAGNSIGSTSILQEGAQVMPIRLKVKRISDAARLPSYSQPGDAGLDLYAIEPVVLPPGQSALVRTGIAVELPSGHEAQIRPRSGLALKHGITVLNSPGTIDQGYRGEIGVILINHGCQPFRIEPGAKIAQMVAQAFTTVEVEEVGDLADTQRGVGGFGSTGD